MTYHPTDSDDDGTVEADIDTTAVSTEQRNIDSLGVNANLSSGQTVPNTTATKIAYDSVYEGESAFWDTTNNQLDPQVDGRYLVVFTAGWNGDTNWSTGNQTRVWPFVNGSAVDDLNQYKIGTGQQQITVSTIVELTTSDSLDIRAYQNSGSDQILQGQTDKTTVKAVHLG
jgi:hypothetical protein